MSEQLVAEMDRHQLALEAAAMQVHLFIPVHGYQACADDMFLMLGLCLMSVRANGLEGGVASAQVWKGAEDGRLLRLLVKLSSVLERPESDGDPQWAETG